MHKLKNMNLLPYQPSTNGTHYAPVSMDSTRKPFIEANTIEGDLSDIRSNHIIPVFTKDNEPLISQLEFIEMTQLVAKSIYHPALISSPNIRISHPVKGRVPEARNKPANQLEDWERTIYYERMAFILEISSLSRNIGGERISLTIGGVKAYNLDNISGKKGSEEHFKIFIGYKVSVCTNLCVFSDGFVANLKVRDQDQLFQEIYRLIRNFDGESQLEKMEQLQNYSLSESQFAQLVGRCRMYQHLPQNLKIGLPEMQFGDSQINSVIKDYYRDESFCRSFNGDINLWRLYNLFTAANKASYIDTFLDRASSASEFVGEIQWALDGGKSHWFLG